MQTFHKIQLHWLGKFELILTEQLIIHSILQYFRMDMKPTRLGTSSEHGPSGERGYAHDEINVIEQEKIMAGP